MVKPNHTASVVKSDKKYRVIANGVLIAESERALLLHEVYGDKQLKPVVYIPVEDCYMKYFEPSALTSFCAIKGDAGYYDLNVDGRLIEQAAWFYDDPFALVSLIKGHVSFYSDKTSLEFGD